MRARHAVAWLIGIAALLGGVPVATQAPNEHVRIVLIGDSTVAEGAGWGPGFRAAFGPEVDIVNLALNGRSSKSFLAEGAWTAATPKGAHYVLIQFGHNDNPGKGADRETDPTTTYRANLLRFIADARAASAVPILVTSIVRRNLTPDGHVKTDANLPYVDEVRRLAAERHVLLMDMYALTLKQCETMGPAECASLNATTADGGPDTTHLNGEGQRLVGTIASHEFIRVVLPAQSTAEPRTVAATTVLPLNRTRTTFPMPEPRRAGVPSLVIIGDSTVRNGQGDGAGGVWGWGDMVEPAFDASRLNVVNRAISGLSSRTYVTLGHWERVLALLKRGDVLLMQFGHNDAAAVNDPTRARGSMPGLGDETTVIENMMTGEREVVHTYGWYMKKMIAAARAKGVSVVVCSPVPRNAWKDNRIVRAADYQGWAADVARRNGAAFIDLAERIGARYETFGADAVRAFFPIDNTHTNRAGAELNAAEVIQALRGLPGNPLGAYFSRGGALESDRASPRAARESSRRSD